MRPGGWLGFRHGHEPDGSDHSSCARGRYGVISVGREGSVTVADDRVVTFLDGGDPSGFPVLGLHGTPGCRLSRWPDDTLYASCGVRYITTDRAGYGQSSRHVGRSVADEAADVLAVADALGLARFAVVGGSGGGPHALACAALLGNRVTRVACQSSLAPLGPGGLAREEWLEGMTPVIARELSWAESGTDALVAGMTKQQRTMELALDGDAGSMLGEGLSESDQAFLRRPEVVDAFSRIISEQAAHGIWGSVDDTLAFVRPWGFPLSDIAIPVKVTHGALDYSAPLRHGQWLAGRIPGAVLEISRTGGHMPEEPELEIADTMRWLIGDESSPATRPEASVPS